VNDLETRLRSLDAIEARPTPTAGTLREQAAGRRRRRRRRQGLVVLAVTMVLLIAGTLAGLALSDDQSQQLTVGPSGDSTSVTTAAQSSSNRTLGGVAGVGVAVSPSHDLLDGQLVEVHISGLERLPAASVVMCAGDLTDATAASSCDFEAVANPATGESVQVVATAQMQVSVARTLRIARGSTETASTVSYDCATEPAGCVLAVGPLALPARAVLVPLTFQDVPVAQPAVSLIPATGLRAGQQATLIVKGLRPLATYKVTQCRLEGEGGCDVLSEGSVTADGEGRVSSTVAAWASIYRYDGRVDCTAEPCAVTLTTAGGEAVVGTPLQFAPDVVAPVPSLTIDPTGPYRRDQLVTVRGSGFRPGHDMVGEIGQCPADKDTATEERCTYDLYTSVGSVVVDANGRFTTTVRLTETLVFTGSCRGAPGCVLGWVIPHGTTLAKVPLTFAP